MIITNPYACPQNHPCPAVRRCPAGAIVQQNTESAPRIEQDLCTECGACSDICRVFIQVNGEEVL